MLGERQEDVMRNEAEESYSKFELAFSISAALFFPLLIVFAAFNSCRMKNNENNEEQRIEENKKFCAKFSSEKGEECPVQCQGVFTSGRETGDCSCFKESNYAQIPGRCLSPKMSGASK